MTDSLYLPKKDVYQALSSLGYYCSQTAQAVFPDKQLPAIVFRVGDNSAEVDLDNDLGRQSITIIVDIFANDSKSASEVLAKADTAMRKLDYRLSYSADVPAPAGALYHIVSHFDTVR